MERRTDLALEVRESFPGDDVEVQDTSYDFIDQKREGAGADA